MSASCKGNCIDYKQVKTEMAQSYYAIKGTVYCATCCLFINYEGTWCPCCSAKVRKGKK